VLAAFTTAWTFNVVMSLSEMKKGMFPPLLKNTKKAAPEHCLFHISY
jgi:hypothetical protein